jgi:hypothetical protein
MVVTNLIGGLGNQMFQYAAGRALSLKHQTSLRLDISGFANYTLHQGFELQKIFNVEAQIACKTDIDKILGWQSLPFVRRALLRPSMAAFRHENYIIEPHFHFWSTFHKLTKHSYLQGYWQSEKYFTEVATQIREDFAFKIPMKKKDAELVLLINQHNSVSLHVRRGDYASNPEAMSVHGLCTIEYYQIAIKYIAERVNLPNFYIFSDDIAWVQDNLKINYPHQYINHNHGAESFNDMRLMSLCKHHIIANSSFSWWGAWLNKRADKIVVAPKSWFFSENNIQDLIPKSWVRL